MKIGIIGIGNIGSNLARLFVKAGHEVVLSWSRSPEKLLKLSIELGNHHTAIAASVLEAVQDVDITILSVRFAILDEVIKQMGNTKGKIIIDTNNQFDIKLPNGMTAAEEVQQRLPGIRLVKSFNSFYYELLLSKSFSNPLTIMPMSSDDVLAKELVKGLISSIGFQPLDLGGLSNVHLQEVDGPFYNKVLTLREADSILSELGLKF